MRSWIRFIVWPLAVLALAGCELTPTQKKWAGFAAGVIVVGAIAVHEQDNGKPTAGATHVHTPTVECGRECAQ